MLRMRACKIMAERHRGPVEGYRHSSSPETEAVSAEAEPITLKLGAEDVRKLKETVNSFNTVLGSIDNEMPGPSRLALSGSRRKGGKCRLYLLRQQLVSPQFHTKSVLVHMPIRLHIVSTIATYGK